MKIQSYLLLLLISTLISVPLHGRGKGAVTQDKVTGSIIDIIRQRDEVTVERDKLKMENELLKTVSSSSWLLVNDSGTEVGLYQGGTLLAKAPANTVKDGVIKTEKPLKVGDRLKLKLGEKTVKLKLKPGETESHSANGKNYKVTIDFLTGSRAWLLLVR